MSTAFRVELIESIDALQSYREAYEALVAALPGNARRPFSIDALQAAAPLYLGPHDTPWFLLAWRGDKLCGVAPLALQRRRWPRLRRLHGWGDIHGMQGLDPEVLIPDPDDARHCMQAFADFMTGRAASAYDVVALHSVREDSALGRLFSAVFPDATRGLETEVSHLVDLPATAAAYGASLDATMMKHLRRCERALQRDGTVEFCTRDSLEPDELEAVMAIHSARQTDLTEQGKERLNLFDAPVERQTFMQLLETDARSGHARNYLLKFDGRVIAFCLGYASAGFLVWHTTAFDPAFRKYGPGRLVAMRMFDAEIEQHGTRCIDMGKGTTQVKRDFGNRRVAHLQFEWLNTRSRRSRWRQAVWRALSQAASLRRKWFSNRLSPVVSTSVITQYASEIARYGSQ